MGSLNNLFVSSSFQGLLKMSNSVTGVTNSLQTVQSGDGTNTALQISTNSVNVSGSFYINGTQVTNGTSGTSGLNGSNGTSGTSGSSGGTGSSGSSGSNGTSGTSGSSGRTGSSGSTGSNGTSGTSGTSPIVANFITTGSIGGTQTITGSLRVSGSLKLIGATGSANGIEFPFIYNGTAQNSSLIYQNNNGDINIQPNAGINLNTSTVTIQNPNGDGLVNVYGQYPNLNLQANQFGSGSQYPQITYLVDNTTYPGNIFGGYQVQDAIPNDPNNTQYTVIGLAANTYTPEAGPELVGWIGGGGSNVSGSNSAILLRSTSANMEVHKPTNFHYNITGTSGSFNYITAITADITNLHTIYETSSVIYSSGSNQLGNNLSNTQILSGSVKVQGSLTVNGTTFSNGTSGTSGVNGSSGTSGINGSSGTSGLSALGLPSKNIFVNNTGWTGFIYISNPSNTKVITFTTPFIDTNYSIDYTYKFGAISGSSVSDDNWYDLTGPNSVKITNKTISGFTLSLETIDNAVGDFTGFTSYATVIHTGESNGSGLNGSSGTSGTSGSSGGNGSSGTSGSSGVTGSSGTSGSSGVSPSIVGFVTTGSATLQQSITGSLIISGSGGVNPITLTINGGFKVNDVNGQTINLLSNKNLNLSSDDVFTIKNTTSSINLIVTGSSGQFNIQGNTNVTGALSVSGSNTLIGNKYVTGSVFITGSKTIIGSNTVIGTNTISGSLLVTGSQTITGSIYGNVTALSITSNTASLDLSQNNLFTLQLVSGSNTFINPSNIRAGQTINLLLSTTGSATVSFPTSVKQISGSVYVPTVSTSKDIITLVSFDSTNIYLAQIKNLV